MGERLEDRARRIANDIEGRDLEAAETLRAMAARTPGPATAAMVEAAKGWLRLPVTDEVRRKLAAFIDEHEPA